MHIKKTDSGLLHSCMYIVEENGHALVIDPCKKTDIAEGLKVDYLMITHEHYDHISGVNEWKEKTGAPLLCSKACAQNICNPIKNLSRMFDVFCQMQTWFPSEKVFSGPVEYVCEADLVFEDQLELDWQGHHVVLLEIPGHSAGSIGIDLDVTDFFSGDSLLEGKEVELRLPGGNRKQWEETGKDRINTIPVGTRIWPGHFESFTKQSSIQNQNGRT